MKPTTLTKKQAAEQKTKTAYLLIGISTLLIFIAIIIQSIVTIKLIAGAFIYTQKQQYNEILNTPLIIVALITTGIITIAFILGWVALSVAPDDAGITPNIISIIFIWFISILGTIIIWYVYSEKYLQIETIPGLS